MNQQTVVKDIMVFLCWILTMSMLISCTRKQPADAVEDSEEQLLVEDSPTENPTASDNSSTFQTGLQSAMAGDLAEAEAAYRKTVASNRFAFEAWYNLGLLLYKQNRLEEAKQAFLQVAQNTRASRFNRVYYQLGLIAAEEGDDQRAIQYYEESQLLDPSHVQNTSDLRRLIY